MYNFNLKKSQFKTVKTTSLPTTGQFFNVEVLKKGQKFYKEVPKFSWSNYFCPGPPVVRADNPLAVDWAAARPILAQPGPVFCRPILAKI